MSYSPPNFDIFNWQERKQEQQTGKNKAKLIINISDSAWNLIRPFEVLAWGILK